MAEEHRHLLGECTVRAPRATDFNRMADLAGQLGYPCTGDQIRSRMDEMHDPNEYAVYVAELSTGGIAGWIGVFLFRAVALDKCAEINGLIVDQTIRSYGIGKILLGAAEQWARNVGCSAISVHSNIRRGRAHQFYTRNGYQWGKTQELFTKNL